MELLKGQGAQERVKEVLRISADGSMVKKKSLIYLLIYLLAFAKMKTFNITQRLIVDYLSAWKGDCVPAQRREGFPCAGSSALSPRRHFYMQP